MQTQAHPEPPAHQLVAITGRFQPFHRGHMELVAHGLSLAPRILIGITNPDPRSWTAAVASAHRHRADANPFSYLQRLQIIAAALHEARIGRERYDVVPFPLDSPRVWSSYIPHNAVQLVRVFSDWEQEKARHLAAGGYQVKVLIGEPDKRISASDIRAAMSAGQPWAHWVPPGARERLAALRTDPAE